MIKYLNTYAELEQYKNENEQIGFANDLYNSDGSNQFDLWMVDLFKNKETGKYSILIIADSDEQWAVIEFHSLEE